MATDKLAGHPAISDLALSLEEQRRVMMTTVDYYVVSCPLGAGRCHYYIVRGLDDLAPHQKLGRSWVEVELFGDLHAARVLDLLCNPEGVSGSLHTDQTNYDISS